MRGNLVSVKDAGGLSRWAARAIEQVRTVAVGGGVDRSLRVTLNFHPDRVTGRASVLTHLAGEGVYRCQFETGSSNGGLTAHPGGDRWLWEQRIFGHAYDDAPACERPKYGALNHRRRRIGGAPRFGSAHLRLNEPVLDRTTFCFPDSVLQPKDLGTADRFDLIRLANAFDAVPRSESDERVVAGALDDYIEAHVHGVVRIDRDVEALVLDPSYRDTVIEEQAQLLGTPVEWHEGRTLTVADLAAHPHYRGHHVIDVGRRIARDGVLDAFVIGQAVLTGHEDPQDLKKVWHHVARFGTSAAIT
jgi:hypothetical protein